MYTSIIDEGSCFNLALDELVELNLKTEEHSNLYQITWLNDKFILVSSQCPVTFNFGKNFELYSDVLPMKVAHIVLGRPFLSMRGFNVMDMHLYTYT